MPQPERGLVSGSDSGQEAAGRAVEPLSAPTEPADFPAAHSMDTTWFAVDRDGRVAAFDSGEPGAVPAVVFAGGDPTALGVDLAELPEVGPPKPQLWGILHPGLRRGVDPPPRRTLERGDEPILNLLLFRAEPDLPAEVRALPGVEVGRMGRYFAVVFAAERLGRRDPRREVWRRFQLAAERDPRFVTAEQPDHLELAWRGLFVYRSHHERFNIPEPYGRVLDPAEPVLVSELPLALSLTLGLMPRFDLSFADTRYLQPVELVPCEAWHPPAGYLARDGRTARPLPGHEDEYEPPEDGFDDDEDRFHPLRVEGVE